MEIVKDDIKNIMGKYKQKGPDLATAIDLSSQIGNAYSNDSSLLKEVIWINNEIANRYAELDDFEESAETLYRLHKFLLKKKEMKKAMQSLEQAIGFYRTAADHWNGKFPDFEKMHRDTANKLEQKMQALKKQKRQSK